MYTNITVESDAGKYEEGEGSYDITDWPYRVMGKNGDGEDVIIYLCANQQEADHLAKILIANPIQGGERIING